MKNRMANSIRKRLLVNFAGLAVFPLLLVGVAMFVMGFTVQKQQALNLQHEVALRVAEEAASRLGSLEDALHLASGLIDLVQGSAQERSRALEILKTLNSAAFEELVILDRKGMALTRVTSLPGRKSADGSEAEQALARSFANGAHVHAQVVHYSPLHYGDGDDEPEITLAMPLSVTGGAEVEAVLVAQISLRNVLEMVRDVRRTTGQRVYIVDGTGRMAAHTDPNIDLRATTRLPPEEDGIARGYDGAWVLQAVDRIRFGDQVFTVVAERTVPQALYLAFSASGVLIGVLIVSLVAAVGLAYLQVRRIVRPVQNLASTVRNVRSGDFTERAEVEGQDEIGELAEAFNDMTGQLQRTMSGLREKIEELTSTQSKLRESEGKYRGIYEQATDGILLRDQSGAVLDANPRALEILGYTREEILGRPLVDLMHEEDRKRRSRELELEVILDGGTIQSECRLRTSRGDYVSVDLGEKLVGRSFIQSMFRDITHRKRMENELMRATRAAEDANQAKTMFLRNMSHEIRTPLGCVIGMSEMVLEEDLDEDIQGQVEMILDSANSLLDIINDILDFTKIEAGKLALNPANFVIRTELEKILRHFATSAARRETELHLDVDPDVPFTLWGDGVRLSQVVRNLVGNAIKFTEQGNVWIAVKVGRKDAEGLLLEFTVKDTGIGVPKDKLGHLFKSFTQVDSSFSKKFPGTGLGLAISKKIVEMLGGDISVESEFKKGSTFSFSARFGLAREPERVPDEPVNGPLVTLEPRRILFAEDNRINRLFISDFLQDAGHTVVQAGNGVETLGHLGRERFDLILMDIQMPELDGVETARRIRRGESGENSPDIPIIALTAYAMKDDRERFLDVGMDHVVSKPVKKRELFEVIESIRTGAVS